jgi:hypothetical protein
LSFSELVFYALVLISVPIIISIIRSFARRRSRAGWMMLRMYLLVIAVYAVVLISTSLALPIRVLPVGEPQYSGDWSITADSPRRLPHGLDEDYEVDFLLDNRSAKPVHGPSELTVYLVDENGVRYNAEPEPSSPPFDAWIQPGKQPITTRKFVLPTNLNRIELVIAREGFRLGWFIIGRYPFDGRTVVQLL